MWMFNQLNRALSFVFIPTCKERGHIGHLDRPPEVDDNLVVFLKEYFLIQVQDPHSLIFLHIFVWSLP